MDDSSITETLQLAEAAVKAGDPLGPTGFWKAVAAVKADPTLIEANADRIGVIDSIAFRNWALLTVPLWIGNLLSVGGALFGIALIAWAYSLDGTQAAIAFLLGFGAILVTTHSLGHLVTGTFLRIRFTRWFVGSIRRPQPGVKVDYASYLRAPAQARAWMHASGAIVTKIVPFALIGAALASGVPSWVVWVLVGVGIGQIVTDLLWSTKASDWKKYRREMHFSPQRTK